MQLHKLSGILLVTSIAWFPGCAWNRKSSEPESPPPSATNQHAPLDNPQYSKLIDQFNGSGDDYEKQVRGLEEDSWSDSLKKATAGITGAFKVKPRVTPASDPVSLSTGIPPLSPELYYQAGQLAEERNKPEEALKQYSRALSKDPKHLSATIATARLLDRMGNHVQAVKLYEGAISDHPDEPAPYNDLGLSLARKKQWPAARIALQKAVQLAPKETRYRNNLAMVLVNSGQIDEALRQLSAVNRPAAAHYNVAFLLNQAGRSQEAVAQLRLALQKEPELAAAGKLLAKIGGAPAGGATQVARRTPEIVRPDRPQQVNPVQSVSLRLPEVRATVGSVAPPTPQGATSPTAGPQDGPHRLPQVSRE